MEEQDDLDKLVDSLINAELSRLVAKEIAPYTCQFLKQDNAKGMIPFASGVLAKFRKSYYIISASHVIEDWSDENKLFVEIRNGFISVAGKGAGTTIEKENKLDIAYIKLKKDIVPALKKRYKFLQAERFLYNIKLFDEANYCIYGFPVANPKNSNGRTLGSAHFVRPCQDKVFQYYGLDPLSHYVLEFKGKAVNIASGIKEKIRVEHYGLSGGGLWYTTVDYDGRKFRSAAYLIGIMMEFRRSKYDCLIANRIEIFLASVHQNEGVKFKSKG